MFIVSDYQLLLVVMLSLSIVMLNLSIVMLSLSIVMLNLFQHLLLCVLDPETVGHPELVSGSARWFFRSRNKFGMTFVAFGMTFVVFGMTFVVFGMTFVVFWVLWGVQDDNKVHWLISSTE